jgi:hypothetical protein
LRRLSIPLIILATALLAGCGDDASPEEDEIRGVVTQFNDAIRTGDLAAYCSSVVMLQGNPNGPQEPISTLSQEEIDAAIAASEPSCRKDPWLSGPGEVEVEVEEVQVDGDTAMVELRVSESDSPDDEMEEGELLRGSDGEWRFVLGPG